MARAELKEPRLILDLSLQEAAVIRTILAYVGGNPRAGHPRSHVDTILASMDDIGVEELPMKVIGSIMIDKGAHDGN